METFRSNGKLLLTGEYTVLDGAEALALPTRYGQKLIVEKSSSDSIHWTSVDHKGHTWFEDTIALESIKSQHVIDQINDVTKRLIEIFRAIFLKKPDLFNDSCGYTMRSELDFNKSWGLGSSSTLINNLANWARINPFELLENTFGGSGYDIACAQSHGPLIFQNTENGPFFKEILFHPAFEDKLYFVYLNQKQDSREGIASYKNLGLVNSSIINDISSITSHLATCQDFNEFNNLILKHETIVALLIQQRPIKERLFNDFSGEVKSLGAWGGDFVLVTSETDPTDYFLNRGYPTVIPYYQIIL